MTQAEMQVLHERLNSFEASIRQSIQASFRDVFDRINEVAGAHAACRAEMASRITALETARGIRRWMDGWALKGVIAVGSAAAAVLAEHYLPRLWGG